MIGVNQRDLYTFEVDHERAVRMAGVIPDGVVKVAESGVRGADDARMLRDAGYDAILVGETLVTAADPRSTIVRTPSVAEVSATWSNNRSRRRGRCRVLFCSACS